MSFTPKKKEMGEKLVNDGLNRFSQFALVNSHDCHGPAAAVTHWVEPSPEQATV